MGPSGESQLASLASGRSVDLDFERPLLSGEGKRYQCHALSFSGCSYLYVELLISYIIKKKTVPYL